MKYTKYFSGVLKNQGVPNLDPSQYARLMNIIHLEGVVHGVEKAKSSGFSTSSTHQYDMVKFSQESKLTELTGNLQPQNLLDEMLKMSKIN